MTAEPLVIRGQFSAARMVELREIFHNRDVVFPSSAPVATARGGLQILDWRGNSCDVSDEVLEVFRRKPGWGSDIGDKYVLIRSASRSKDMPIGWHPDSEDMVVCHSLASKTATFIGIHKDRLRPTGERLVAIPAIASTGNNTTNERAL